MRRRAARPPGPALCRCRFLRSGCPSSSLQSGVIVSTPLVSVIGPTYNRTYCPPRTLDSVLAQRYPRFEPGQIGEGSTGRHGSRGRGRGSGDSMTVMFLAGVYKLFRPVLL
jgi:hypothetical protein